jgi:Flp pilus assembly protein TadD
MNRPAFPMAPPHKLADAFSTRCAVKFAGLAVTMLLGACSGNPLSDGLQAAGGAPPSVSAAIANNQTDLEKATLYWSKEYEKNTRDLKAALSYVKNLKAGGHKERALSICRDASIYHGSNRELASEYGRLALEMGQVNLAEHLLSAADNPADPDWRVVSARGTVFAKQGKYSEAIPHYERALNIAPDASSVLSNLAMAYAAGGRAAEAEPLLRRAIEVDGSNAKLKQNLALVMGLQGKHDEAKHVEGQNLANDAAKDNADVVRQMVKTAPSPEAAIEPQLAANAPDPAKAKTASAKKTVQPELRQTTADAGAEPNWDKLVSMAIANSDTKPAKR